VPTCRKCLTGFPNLVVVGGKQRNVGNRKFCLQCSPFGQRNTRDLTRPRRLCAACGVSNCVRANKFCADCIAMGKSLHRITAPEHTKDPQTLRRYLLRTRGHVCQGCSRTEWEGHPIPLETEHVDGNSENNAEENLKLLCANCHALTPTYKAKNRGKGRHARRERYAEGKSY